MSTKKSALGKGLSALLENSETDVTHKSASLDKNEAVVGSVTHVDISQIEPNPFQPRSEFSEESLQELAASIRTLGIIQPITVRKLGYDRYQIISGERRFRASGLAGLKTIPAYIRIANDQAMLEMALVENIQRENLNAIEVAIGYQRLIEECDLTQEEMSERVGKSRSTVTNYLRLLKLPPEIQAAIRDEKITMGHARAILAVDDIAHQILLYKEILENDLNVRDVEDLARRSGSKGKGKKDTKSKMSQNQELNKIQNLLSSHFNSRVTLSQTNSGKGKIIIPFNDDDDLNRLLELLNY
ncbi:MAG: ParB/RepB/Spo0J family partition protein [Bacteroidetes bacterium]|nr:MAG: ParB/RepB/Spo0J family partition protein [Bacteroidota bacterium]REK34133.1 MAG: ParB/RepB/Spo0J family partition protein [Bacteroidota bacterium]REK50464.1 MAG: ParB/RepB/Spo0J family partition protein [Bacteroidota bacterium]